MAGIYSPHLIVAEYSFETGLAQVSKHSVESVYTLPHQLKLHIPFRQEGFCQGFACSNFEQSIFPSVAYGTGRAGHRSWSVAHLISTEFNYLTMLIQVRPN